MYTMVDFLLVVIIVLIVAFTDNIFKTVPVFKKLFTDPINYMLLIVLVILFILIDMCNGIILAFLVLYLSVYMNQNKQNNTALSNRNSNININNVNNVNNVNNNSVQRKVHFSDVEHVIAPQSIRSNSEFIYNNTKPFPNGNLKPFQPTYQDEMKSVVPEPTNQNLVPDFITSVGLPNRDSYDIVGCRYDFKNSPQNLTKNGPPLAQCNTYSGEQTTRTGTVFYPLHG